LDGYFNKFIGLSEYLENVIRESISRRERLKNNYNLKNYETKK
jgi:hypothetical protein